jgi:hypothetical protein
MESSKKILYQLTPKNTLLCNKQIETNAKNIFLHSFFNTQQFAKEVQLLHQLNIYTLGNISFFTQQELEDLFGVSQQFISKLNQVLKAYNLGLKKQGAV